MSTPEERLAEIGLTVPEVVPPVAAYQPTARSGNLLFTARVRCDGVLARCQMDCRLDGSDMFTWACCAAARVEG